MAGNRWNNLDFNPPGCAENAPAAGPLSPPGGAASGPAPADPGSKVGANHLRREADHEDPVAAAMVRQAQGAYFLRNYQVVVDHLEEPLRLNPGLTGGQRLLGQALARLNREAEAIQ